MCVCMHVWCVCVCVHVCVTYDELLIDSSYVSMHYSLEHKHHHSPNLDNFLLTLMVCVTVYGKIVMRKVQPCQWNNIAYFLFTL